MLAIGDMHASMGDGEVSGTGVEIDGEVLIRVGLIRGMRTLPVTELADSWVDPRVTDSDLDEAIRLACDEAAACSSTSGVHARGRVHLLVGRVRRRDRPGLPPLPRQRIARVRVPKIDACPTPFRSA